METSSITTLSDRFNNWVKNSVTIKLMSIGFLILILLIPSAWIESLIRERQNRADSVVKEIADKWAGEQSITGPVLVIPYTKYEKIDKGKDGIEIRSWAEKAFFLPENLEVSSKVNPQILHRGIFETAVYESEIALSGNFGFPDFKKLKIDDKDVLWKDAYLATGISDLRGISKIQALKSGDKDLAGEPANSIGIESKYTVKGEDDSEFQPAYTIDGMVSSQNGIVALLGWEKPGDFVGPVTVKLNLKGSTRLYFVPVGKNTQVSMEGPWASPSFDGEFLPATREVSESGFKATWNILHYNRPFSQQWSGEGQKLSGADFGVKLLIPVDQYQKSMRSAKYSVLIILLTFVALFMVEIMRKIRIHPFQYILIGAALIIYYTLLLSLSEHIGYNYAYLVASVATILLVGWYAVTFLVSRKLIAVFVAFLSFFYSFIFVIIQLQDYSLLLGSIGLFLIIGLIMYFSRGIRWYKEELATPKE